MGIRQWFSRAANARKKWFGSYKKKRAEQHARRKDRELHREIDDAMLRDPQLESLPTKNESAQQKQTIKDDDDWFTPVTPVTPST